MANNLVRQQPNDFLSLRDAMDRLFDESFLRPFGDGGWTQASAPAVDVCETNDKVMVTASIPGMKPEDIKITVIGDQLQLSGEMKEDNDRDEGTYHVRERRFGNFSRSIYLPTPVVSDKAEAIFENGVLKLTLPKAEEARPKAIKVNLKK